MQLPQYPRYESYRDSGLEWLGEIPNGWKLMRLRDVFNFSKGLTITKENLQDTGIPCVNYGEVHSKYPFEVAPERHDLKCVDESYLSESPKSLIRRGDFVFADTSEDLEGAGNFTVLNSDTETFAGYHTIIARPIAGISPRFLAYVLASETARNQTRRKVKGVKVFSVTNALLKSNSAWFPDLSHQQAIARFLDDKTGKLDRAVKIKKGQIALLRERKQIIIQEAVTKGLNPSAAMKDSGIDWIGQIPAHWDVENPKWLFRHRKEKARRGEQQLAATQKYGVIPQQEYMELEGRRIVQVFLDFDILKHVEAGDFVMSMRSFQGGIEYSDYTGCVSSAYVAMEPGELIHAPYYKYLLKSPRFIEALQVTSNLVRDGQALRFDNFTMVTLPVVPLDEQRQIAAHIDDALAKSDRAIELKERQIEALKEYKATLINAAVTGKIRVI